MKNTPNTYREFINAPPDGFPFGLSIITDSKTHEQIFPDLEINFAILHLKENETVRLGKNIEIPSIHVAENSRLNIADSSSLTFNNQATAIYLAQGKIDVELDNVKDTLERKSTLDFIPHLNTYEDSITKAPKTATELVLNNPENYKLNKNSDSKNIISIINKLHAELEQKACDTYIEDLQKLPKAICFSHDKTILLKALCPTKLIITQRPNKNNFDTKIIKHCKVERFGERSKNDERFVSEIISLNFFKEANLTLGDIWPSYEGVFSSYAPHKHNQPEIYYHESNDQLAPGLAQTDNHNFWQLTKNEQTQIINDNKGHSQAHFPYYIKNGNKTRIHDWYLWIMPHLDRTKDVSLDEFRS